MMERKYQLVAWTQNITDKEDARLYMIPSLECEVQAYLGSYSYFCEELRHEFIRLCEEGLLEMTSTSSVKFILKSLYL